jgi:glutathione S-transferase
LETGIDFEHKIIDLKHKPSGFVAKYRQANGGSGNGLVPLLEDGNNLVIESDVVTKYVGTHLDKSKVLYPPESSKTVEDFLHHWQKVTDTYYDCLRATSEREAQETEESFWKALGSLEGQFVPGNGDFLLGTDFSVAECICAPWIQRFYVTLHYFRGLDFDFCAGSRVPRTARWMKAVCHRPSAQESKCPEEEMIAACKRYYVSYVSEDASGRL